MGQHWEMPLHFLFFDVPALHSKVKSCSTKRAEDYGGSLNLVQKNKQGSSFQQFLCCTTPWLYEGKVP